MHHSSSRSQASSLGSVDGVLQENFSGTDSSCDLWPPESQSSASRAPQPVPSWWSKLWRGVRRDAAKRRARKLFSEFVRADDDKDGQDAARRRRSEAAAGLLNIIGTAPDGEAIVAWRFVKDGSKQGQGARALLRLSDDELDQLGYKAVSPVSEPLAFTMLLGAVMKYTSAPRFFQNTISLVWTGGEQGAAGILYLAETQPTSFCMYIQTQSILDFCRWAENSQTSDSPIWHCGARLFCIFLVQEPQLTSREKRLMIDVLLSICMSLIRRETAALDSGVSGKHSETLGPSGLPLIAVCCAYIRGKQHWRILPVSETVTIFLERLITLLDPGDTSPLRISNESGYALSTLLSLLETTGFVSALPKTNLSQLGNILVAVALGRRVLVFMKGDSLSQRILKRLNSNLDRRCIDLLCRLPGPTFSGALTSALTRGILQLDAQNATIQYEHLYLVDRLLWLSNITEPQPDAQLIHRAVVKGDGCGFLAYVLSYGGGSPQDRGIWRVKGLAITCLGNIIERMDKDQIRDHVTNEMIDAVVAVKEHQDVPLVQKGQAIFTLQRYTLAADRCGILPHYRENTSNMDGGFRSAEADDNRSP